MSQVLTAAYRTRESAVRAAERLLEAGFTRDEVCLLAPDDRHGSHFAVRPVSSALPGFGGGAMIGMLLGAVAAIVYSFTGMPVEGLELLEGQPLLLLGLCGAGAGALVGGLLGAMVGVFRTHHEAIIETDEHPGHGGYMLVGVTAPRNMARSAAELLQISGASRVTRS